MNLNALTNLTPTTEKPSGAPEKANKGSGFETVFQEADSAGTSTEGSEEQAETTVQDTEATLKDDTVPDLSQPKRDTAQASVARPDADDGTLRTVSAEIPAEFRKTNPSSVDQSFEPHSTHGNETDVKVARSDQERGDNTKGLSVPLDAGSTKDAARNAETPSLVSKLSTVPVSSASPSAQTTTETDIGGTAVHKPTSATLVTAPTGPPPLEGRDPVAQATSSKAHVNAVSVIENAPETTTKSSDLSIEGQAKNGSTAVPTPLAAPSIDPSSIDTPDKATLPQAMSLLERHLGGFAVRLLPQKGPAQEVAKQLQTPAWSQPENPKTVTTVLASASTNTTTSSATQALYRLTGPEKTNAAHLQADLRFRPELGPNTIHSDVAHQAGWDVRPSAVQNAVNVSQPLAARPEMAAHVAQQIADALKGSNAKSVEIALSPLELGRVRMVLSPSDAGLTLNILAERPDTLDLMRRNIDDLSKSFSDLGYEDISFSFEQNDQMKEDGFENPRDGQHQMAALADMSEVSATPTGLTAHLAISPDGIDIRL